MINKTIIKVPRGINYFSEWNDFKFPQESCIFNKKIPGCGFTEWVLGNDEDIILCSPRIMLIKNKFDQHPEIFPVMSQMDQDLDVDKDLQEDPRKRLKEEQDLAKELKSEEKEVDFTSLYFKIESYINKREFHNQPIKLIVTYDSFRILKDLLIKLRILDKFKIYVDEFQSILTDSRFKADTELTFINCLKDLNPFYVSATPMMDDYIEELDDFKNLPFYELDWESEQPSRIMKPNLDVRISSHGLLSSIKPHIQKYLDGKFEKSYRKDKEGNLKIVESRELVVYVNSVNNILSIISHMKLTPDQVNILCANTPKNTKKIQKKLGRTWNIGSVPLRNEPRKMFTFCTRTVYLGADFYSDNARTIVLSDAVCDTLSVDISLDLPQILGRQRLDSNPWKNSAIFYFRPLKESNKKPISREEFDKIIKNKIELTNHALSLFDKGTEKERAVYVSDQEDLIKINNYKKNYVSVNKHNGNSPKLVFNNLVLISEKRAFDIQSIDYKDRFSVFNRVDQTFDTVNPQTNEEVSKFFEKYDKLTTIQDKLRMICETSLSEDARKRIEGSVDDLTKNYLSLGEEKLKNSSYNISRLKKELDIKTFDKSLLEAEIYKTFELGKAYSRINIKTTLKLLYDKTGYKITAKATDLINWFDIEEVYIRVNGKKTKAIKILKKR